MMSATDLIETSSVAATASFVTSLLIVLTQDWHGKHSLDKDIDGVQKFHTTPVPRVGGIALLVGILTGVLYYGIDASIAETQTLNTIAMLLLAALPAFIAGGIEDVTKKVSVRARLFATFGSAILASWLLNASLPRLDVWGVDTLLQLSPLIAVAVTAFAVAGVANSINIIDGFHGVAGSAVIIMLAGMGFLAYRADDALMVNIAVLGIGTSIGFLFVNYPTGRLFMGDGGAYFLGFWVAETAVLLIARNPSINAWQVLAICSYPVIEVIYSIYRKKVIRKLSPGMPDRLHLHMLIYRRLVWKLVPRNDAQPWIRNAAVACFIATWIAAMTLIAVFAGDTVPTAVAVVIGNAMLYIAIYTRLVCGYWRINPVAALGIVRLRTHVRNAP